MPADPLTEYFTPERRERYEELRERFPHWCIDWPRVAAIRATVTPGQRLSFAVDEMRNDVGSWESPPDLGDDVECQTWIEGGAVQIRVVEWEFVPEGVAELEVEVPVAHLALFASITHTRPSHRSGSDRDHLIREWFEQIEGILVSDPRQSEKRGELLKLAVRARFASARAASCPPEEREMREARARAAADKLKSCWHAIGQDIGLIPTRRGGKSDLIPDNWIFDLAEQAQELLAAMRVYEPDTRERDAVRALLLAEPYPAGSSGNRSIAEQYLRDRTREDAYSSWNKEVNLDMWCLRLAFPMLTAEELLTGLSTTTSWRWLPADRLGLDEDALSKRLSQYRHRS